MSVRFAETFRWNDGVDTERYLAVELGDVDLLYYTWSHVHGEGRREELRQSLTEFLASGPARPMPPSVRAQLTERILARELV